MKQNKRVLLFLFIIFVISNIANSKNNSNFNQLKNEWGLSITRFKQATTDNTNIISFKPAHKPKYKHKIIKFLTNVDSSIKSNMVVYRVNSNPVIDFLFINNKLQSTREDWPNITNTKIKQLKSELTAKYGKPTLETKSNLIIYSFSTSKTKVFFQILSLPGNKLDCRIYYYNRKIFNVLLSQ